MRLAWFTPWPPQRSGIAGRSAELVSLLAARGHAIDVFVDERRLSVRPVPATAPAAGAIRVLGAHDYVWRHAQAHYDLPVYQVGNSTLHQFIWPYLFRWPGLAVLHDTRLHHARAHALLSRARFDDYRAEFAWNHPATNPAAAELAVHGFDGHFFYQWPMVRSVLDSSRLAAAHARGSVDGLRVAWPGRPVEYIALGEGLQSLPAEASRRETRRSLGINEETVVFGVFGGLTPDRRVAQVLEAFAAVRHGVTAARLLLVGTPDPALDLDWMLRTAGGSDIAMLVETPSDGEFDRLIAAADVTVHLRWPSAGEMSGPWLRALSAGRPTVITDLEHLSDVPTLDPRNWGPSAPAPADPVPPVAVAVDIMDEAHSLRLAMTRLGTDASLRATLGATARAWWEAEHTVRRMADDYERALEQARTLPAPDAALPPHMRPDPLVATRDLVSPIDEALPARLEDMCGSS